MTEHEELELLKRLILAIEDNEGGLGARLARAIWIRLVSDYPDRVPVAKIV